MDRSKNVDSHQACTGRLTSMQKEKQSSLLAVHFALCECFMKGFFLPGACRGWARTINGVFFVNKPSSVGGELGWDRSAALTDTSAPTSLGRKTDTPR